MGLPKIATVVSEPFQENTYIIVGRDPGTCLVVDPGFQPEPILEHLQSEGLRPVAILNTHGHPDHIAGNQRMKEVFSEAPLVIGRGDAPMLTDPAKNLSTFLGGKVTSPPADELLDDGQTYSVAGFNFLIWEIAGHSPGHIVFVCQDDPEHPWALVGDVLFAGSIGRTDFPLGSFDKLAAGIREKLFSLPDQTVVFPGHGPTTTIGEERRHNPFVGEAR